jgi:hypothetical protein
MIGRGAAGDLSRPPLLCASSNERKRRREIVMTDRNKKRIGLTAAISSLLFIVCGVFALTCFKGSEGAVSEDKSSIAWVCPVDPDLTKEECDWVLLNDPGYLSEEDARANFGIDEEGKGPGVLSANSCSYDSVNNIVNCEGDDDVNSFYIGRTTGPWGIKFLTICIQNVGAFGYSPSINYFRIYGYGGDDTIEVLERQINCQNSSGQVTVIYPFETSWTPYLVAYGGYGTDWIYGTRNADIISGDNDSDRLYGRDGNDYIYGGGNSPAYPDLIYCGNGSDHAYGGGGKDTFNCSDASGSARDYLYGEDGLDIYYASSDGATMNDLSHGALDGNQFYGAGGIDEVFGDYGNDWVVTGGGNDIIRTYYGNDRIFSGCSESDCLVDDDTVYAGPGNDFIEGGNGADNLDGEGGDDCIIGDSYSDYPTERAGADLIVAGSGNDCVYCDDVLIDSYSSCQMVLAVPPGVPGDHAWGCLSENKCPNDCSMGSPAFCDIIE